MGIDPFLETTDIKQSCLAYLFSYWIDVLDVAFRHTVETRLSHLFIFDEVFDIPLNAILKEHCIIVLY